MILMMMVLTTLMYPNGAVFEIELLVPYDEPLTECAGEVKDNFGRNRYIDLTCMTMGQQLVEIEITGAFDV